jgi:hypothetical protein
MLLEFRALETIEFAEFVQHTLVVLVQIDKLNVTNVEILGEVDDEIAR